MMETVNDNRNVAFLWTESEIVLSNYAFAEQQQQSRGRLDLWKVRNFFWFTTKVQACNIRTFYVFRLSFISLCNRVCQVHKVQEFDTQRYNVTSA